MEEVIKKLFEEQSQNKGKRNRVRMRQAESSFNSNFQPGSSFLPVRHNSADSAPASPSKVNLYKQKNRHNQNYVYFKLKELMGEEEPKENLDFMELLTD